MAEQNSSVGKAIFSRIKGADFLMKILIVLCIVSSLLATIQKSEASTSTEPYSVLVVAGQSNAQGDESYAGLMDPPLGSHPADAATKIMWSMGDDQINPNRIDSPTNNLLTLTDIQAFGYFGPEVGLARKLWDQGRRNMVILKVTYGLQRLAQTPNGTFGGLADWNVNSVNESYDNLKLKYSQLKSIMQSNNEKFTVDGFYWMQGESDAAKGESVANYQTNLSELITAARSDLGMGPSSKVVLSKISLQHCLTNEYNFIYNPNGCQVNACFLPQHPCTNLAAVTEGNTNVRQAIQNVADADPNVFAVDSEDLARNNFDFLHMLWQSQLTMGSRFANNAFELPYRNEGSADYDDDTIANFDEDTNNDGNLGNDDSDSDGVPNYLDEIVGIGGGITSSVEASKSVSDSVSGSATLTSRNSLLNWKYTVSNNTNTAATIEVNDHLSDRQSYVAGSLVAPPNYIKSYSVNNGLSFSSVEPGSGVTNVKAVKNDVPISAKGNSEKVLEQASSYTNSTTSNEGYIPILVGDRIFTLFHNTSAGTGPSAGRYDIGCVDKSSGANCVGYPKDFTDASNNTDFLAPWTPGSYYDETTGQIFSSTQRNTGFGIVCFDTTTDAMCAGKQYTQLNATGAPLGGSRKTRIQQVQKIGSCLYTYDIALNVYSYNPTNGQTPCGAQTTKNLVSAYSNAFTVYQPGDHSDAGNIGPISQSHVIGTKMFMVMNYNYDSNLDIFSCGTITDYCRGTRLICFDSAASDGKCSNGVGGFFSNPWLGNCYMDKFCKFTQPFENKSNNTICAFGFQEPLYNVYGITCFNTLTGSLVAHSTALADSVQYGKAQNDNSTYIPSYEETELTLPNGHSATIFSWVKGYLIASPRSGKAVCFDWTANAMCANFGNTGNGTSRWDAWTFNNISSNQVGSVGDTNDFGYVADSAGCVWAKGKSGDIWSFDSGNGSVPCRRVSNSVTVTPTQFFCDSATNHISGWNTAKVQLPVGSSIADIDELKVTLKDTAGNIISGYNKVDLLTLGSHVTNIGELNLTSLSATTYPTVKAEFSFKALNGNIWASSTVEPLAVLTFAGDNPQVCYQTRVNDACDIITPLTNSGLVSVTDENLKVKTLNLSATTNVQYADGQSCIPDIRLTTSTSKYKYYPGDLITYDIDMTNVANADLASTANGVLLNNTIPANTTYVSSSPSGTLNGSIVSWPTFDLAGASNIVHSVTVRVNNNAVVNAINQSNASLANDPTITNNMFILNNEVGTLGSINAKAFHDINEDGINNGGDTPMNNVGVELFKNGISLASSSTNSSGVATFDNLLPASDYVLKYTLPNNYLASQKNAGSDPDIDSDIDTISLSSEMFSVGEGEQVNSKSAGFYQDPSTTTTTTTTTTTSTTSTTSTTTTSTIPTTTTTAATTVPTTTQPVVTTTTTSTSTPPKQEQTSTTKLIYTTTPKMKSATTVPPPNSSSSTTTTTSPKYVSGALDDTSNDGTNGAQIKGEATAIKEKLVKPNAGSFSIPLIGRVKTSTLPFAFGTFIALLSIAGYWAFRRHRKTINNFD